VLCMAWRGTRACARARGGGAPTRGPHLLLPLLLGVRQGLACEQVLLQGRRAGGVRWAAAASRGRGGGALLHRRDALWVHAGQRAPRTADRSMPSTVASRSRSSRSSPNSSGSSGALPRRARACTRPALLLRRRPAWPLICAARLPAPPCRARGWRQAGLAHRTGSRADAVWLYEVLQPESRPVNWHAMPDACRRQVNGKQSTVRGARLLQPAGSATQARPARSDWKVKPARPRISASGTERRSSHESSAAGPALGICAGPGGTCALVPCWARAGLPGRAPRPQSPAASQH